MMINQFNRRGFLAALGAAGAAAGAAAAAPGWAAGRKPYFTRVGRPIGVQLYALGEAAQKDLGGTLKKLSAIGYRDFELPGFYNRAPKDLRADADAAGARFNCIHLSMPNRLPPGGLGLMTGTQELADALNTLGVYKAVLPVPLLPDSFDPAGGRKALLDGVVAGGLDMWKRLADTLNERGAALKPYGIELGYHNHNMEFRPQDGTTGWEVLLGRLDPKVTFLELDLGWITAGGLDPAAELRRLKGRVKMVHLKDVKASTKTNYELQQDPAECGLGKFDWKAVLTACEAAGVEHYYVEQEPPFTRDRFESMKISHDFLARFVA